MGCGQSALREAAARDRERGLLLMASKEKEVAWHEREAAREREVAKDKELQLVAAAAREKELLAGLMRSCASGNLRRRLDQLGYRHPLGIETVPLVERLFSDLVHTTESLKSSRVLLSQKQKETGSTEDRIGPYKADNAKLVKEVNQLHMELVRRKDAMDGHVKKMKQAMRKIEHENADLKFLNTQYAHKLRLQEKDGELKSERIQRLLEKNLKAVVETADGAKQQIATRRQRMEIKSQVEPAEGPAAPAAVPPHQLELLQLADRKIDQLEQQASQLQDQRARSESEHAALKAQVQRREEEIERLGRLLEGGRPPSSVFKDTEMINEERKLAQLGNQVEFLQQTNKALENELVATTSNNEELALKVEEMQSKNSTLVRELSEFDRLSRELQQEKLAARSEGQRELRKERAAIARQQETLAERLTSSQVATNESIRLKGENSHLAAMLSKTEREVERMQSELDRLVQDNKVLGSRAQKAVTREKQLMLRLSRQPLHGVDGSTALASSAVSMAGRDEAAELPLRAEHRDSRAHVVELEEKIAVLETANKSLEEVFRSVEREREYYRNEAANAQLASSRNGVTSPQRRNDRSVRSTPRSVEPLAQECERYKREIRSLTELTRRLELQHDDATTEIASLQHERESLLMLYRQATESRVTGIKHPLQPELPQERELDSDSERVGFERSLAAADEELKVHVERARVLESRLEESEKSCLAAKTKASQLESLLVARMSSSVSAERSPSAGTDAERAQRIRSLEMTLAESQQHGAEAEGQIEKLRAALEALDNERDALATEADREAEALSQCEAANAEKDLELSRASAQAQALQAELEAVRATLSSRDRNVEGLRQELGATAERMDGLLAEIEELKLKADGTQADVDTMVHENQAVREELSESIREREGLKRGLEDSQSKVLLAEHVLEQRERENQQLLESYRSLSSDASKLESRASEADSEMTDARQQLHSKDAALEQAMLQLRAETDAKLRLSQELKDAETAALGLRGEAERLREELAQKERAVTMLEEELSAARGVSMAAERIREDLSSRVAKLSAVNAQLQEQLKVLQLTHSTSARQSESDQSKAQGMEELLMSTRAQLVQSTEHGRQLDAENMALRRSVSELTERAAAMLREIQDLRETKVRLDELVNQLRHAAANRDFEVAAGRAGALTPPSRELQAAPRADPPGP